MRQIAWYIAKLSLYRIGHFKLQCIGSIWSLTRCITEYSLAYNHDLCSSLRTSNNDIKTGWNSFTSWGTTNFFPSACSEYKHPPLMHLELHTNGLGYISNYRTHTHQSNSAYVALYIRAKIKYYWSRCRSSSLMFLP